jgi:NAD(P)-dependent dehydrogenase (short-subunit alcohol dehydrogenase family)
MQDIPGTYIVTGGSSGIGFHACAELLRLRSAATVVVASREHARTDAAVTRLQSCRAIARIGDLGSLSSIQAFARSVRDDIGAGKLPPLRGLLCNAGIQNVAKTPLSSDGFEETFAVNHLGHFALVQRLIRSIEPGGRVVIVSSDVHDPARKTGMPAPRLVSPHMLAGPHGESDTSAMKLGQRRYSSSKLCNLLFAFELDRRLRVNEAAGNIAKRITCNAFNPGLTPGTGLARGYHPLIDVLFRRALPLIALLTGRFNRLQASDNSRHRFGPGGLFAGARRY